MSLTKGTPASSQMAIWQMASWLEGRVQELENENAALKAELAEYERTVAHMRDGARLQDSATAAVLERAEKAEARVAELERDAQWAREFKASQRAAHIEGSLLVSLRMTKDGQYHESRKVISAEDLAQRGAEAVELAAQLSLAALASHINAARGTE